MKGLKQLFYFCVCAIMMCSCINDEVPSAEISVGDSVPVFSVAMNDGTLFDSHNLGGKPALICFFNTTCPDCQKELPVVNEFYNQHSDDWHVVAISRSQNDDAVSEYWQKNNLNIPYSAQSDATVYNLFASSRIPRIYIVSAQGVILAFWTDDPMPTVEQLNEYAN